MSTSTAASVHPGVRRFEAAYRTVRRRRRLRLLGFAAGSLVFMRLAVDGSGFSLERVASGLPRIGDYFYLTLPELRPSAIFADIAYWYYDFPRWLGLLFDTLLIASLATILGAAGGFVFSFPGSRNLLRSYAAYFACRRLMEIARTVPEAVYALVFVVAFGVGPLAGLLALTIHSVGALGKLYAEINENIDIQPLEGVQAAGGNWFEAIRFAVLPQVMPGFATYTLWRFELNVRSAAILGFVGAGGIGQELYHAISLNYYEDVSAIVIMVVLIVTTIDLVCERIRHRMIDPDTFQ